MSKTIVNLTMRFVVSEVERVLETYPDHPYQQAFANPDTRKELIAYVLTQIPNDYCTIEEEDFAAAELATCTTEIQAQMEAAIQQGIESILQESSETINQHIPEEDDGYLSASHWFG